jgi:hypothetical protein
VEVQSVANRRACSCPVHSLPTSSIAGGWPPAITGAPLFARADPSRSRARPLGAGQVLELAVLLSIRLQDEVAFERNFNQLRVYYADARGLLPSSDQEPLLLSLNLLRLLVQNRIAEFHTELELLPPEVGNCCSSISIGSALICTEF